MNYLACSRKRGRYETQKESLVCEEKYPRERKNELVVQLQYSRIVLK